MQIPFFHTELLRIHLILQILIIGQGLIQIGQIILTHADRGHLQVARQMEHKEILSQRMPLV